MRDLHRILQEIAIQNRQDEYPYIVFRSKLIAFCDETNYTISHRSTNWLSRVPAKYLRWSIYDPVISIQGKNYCRAEVRKIESEYNVFPNVRSMATTTLIMCIKYLQGKGSFISEHGPMLEEWMQQRLGRARDLLVELPSKESDEQQWHNQGRVIPRNRFNKEVGWSSIQLYL
jgi:hypothetical protein